jgi:hypothetical protein
MPRRWVEEIMPTGTAARQLLVGRGAWQPGSRKDSDDVAPRLRRACQGGRKTQPLCIAG